MYQREVGRDQVAEGKHEDQPRADGGGHLTREGSAVIRTGEDHTPGPKKGPGNPGPRDFGGEAAGLGYRRIETFDQGIRR
jgi:hypothetical protein